jgi:hypothetical protein
MTAIWRPERREWQLSFQVSSAFGREVGVQGGPVVPAVEQAARAEPQLGADSDNRPI